MNKVIGITGFLLIAGCTTSLPKSPEDAGTITYWQPSVIEYSNQAYNVPEILTNAVELHCPNDMVLVEGDYCSSIEQECINLDKSIKNANGFVKCDEFKSPSKCLSKPVHMKFCMDVYEWPNKKGEMPEVMVSFDEMKNNCSKLGKRVCKDTEWTKACEGQENLPYPYGYKRSSETCNIDLDQKPGFDASKPMTEYLVGYLDQRVPSGSMPDCVSPYGVHDMTGNVDESVINTNGKPHQSAEMGGHWVRGARNRCRPRTVVHNESFKYYEIGGRCCKDSE